MKLNFNYKLVTFLLGIILIMSPVAQVSAEHASFIINEFGGPGSGNGEFSGMFAVTYVNEQYYLADYYNDRIQILDTEGNYVSQFGGTGAGLGQLDGPYHIANNGSHVFVTELINDRISVFNLQGQFIDTFGVVGTGNGEFTSPHSLTIEKGIIYVADSDNERLSIWNETTLQFIGNINHPIVTDTYGIAFGEGLRFEADFGTDTINVFTEFGTQFLYSIGSSGSGVGQFSSVLDVEYVNGHLILSDYGLGKLAIVDIYGNVVKEISGVFNNVIYMERAGNNLLIPDQSTEKLNIIRITPNPSNVIARAGEIGIQLSWEIDNNQGIVDAETYNIYRDPGTGQEFIGESEVRSFTDLTAEEGMNYTYYVEATSILTNSERTPSTEISLVSSDPIPSSDDDEGSSEEGFFESLPLSILPFAIILLLVPILRKRN